MTKPGFVWDQDDPLKRSEGETLNAWAALVDYAHMGPGRSLRVLGDHYRHQTGIRPPSTRDSTLLTWSAAFAWQDRVAAFEGAEAERQTEKYRDWKDAEIERRQQLIADTHAIMPGVLAGVDLRKVPPRDVAVLVKALAEVSRRETDQDVQRLEVADATDHEAKALAILRAFKQARDDDD